MKTLIIDDEIHCTKNLSFLLRNRFEKIEDIKTANSAIEAEIILDDYKPDILFLDIEMPEKNGFQFLKTIDTSEMAIIFVTAHDKYALQAIKCGPTGYVLKPIDRNELAYAFKQAIVQLNLKINATSEYKIALANLTDSLENKEPIDTICLSHSSKLEIIELKTIILLSSDSCYTTFHLENNHNIVMSKTLKFYQTILGCQFIRVHRSYLINPIHIKAFKYEESEILMKNNYGIKVSRRKSNEVTRRLKEM